MRFKTKHRGVRVAVAALAAALAAGDAAAAGGHGFGGGRYGGGLVHNSGHSLGAGLDAAPRGRVANFGASGFQRGWVGGRADGGARHARRDGDGGYYGGYYGGGGVFYDDPGYYGGYYDRYAEGRPTAFSAASAYAPGNSFVAYGPPAPVVPLPDPPPPYPSAAPSDWASDQTFRPDPHVIYLSAPAR